MKKKGLHALTSIINHKVCPKSKRSTHACARNDINKLVSHKRSQTTLYIIIAIVIVAVILLVLTLNQDALSGVFGSKEDDIAKLSREVIDVRNQVVNCFDEALNSTLFINAFHAGYYWDIYDDNYDALDSKDFFILILSKRIFPVKRI